MKHANEGFVCKVPPSVFNAIIYNVLFFINILVRIHTLLVLSSLYVYGYIYIYVRYRYILFIH